MLTDYHLHLRPDEDGTTSERYFTAENVERYLAAAGGGRDRGAGRLRARLPLPPGARPLAPPALGRETAVDDLDAYCEFVRWTPLRLGIECDYVPGAEERTAALLEARDFDYVVGSVHFIGEATRRRPRRLRRLGRQRRPGGGLAPLLRGAGRLRPLRPLRHPRPPRPGQGLGPRAAAARARPARLLRARGRGDRRGRHRGRGLDRGPAQAGRRALPLARVRRDVRRGRGAVRALLRRPPARAGRLRLRPRGRVPRRPRGRGDLRLRAAPAPARLPCGAASADGRDRLRQPPLRRGPAARPRRGRDRARRRASTATPTPTSSPTR